MKIGERAPLLALDEVWSRIAVEAHALLSTVEERVNLQSTCGRHHLAAETIAAINASEDKKCAEKSNAIRLGRLPGIQFRIADAVSIANVMVGVVELGGRSVHNTKVSSMYGASRAA